MAKKNKNFKITLIIMLSLIIITPPSFSITLQNTTTAPPINHKYSFIEYFSPSIFSKDWTYLNIFRQLLPINQLINQYNYSIDDASYLKDIFISSDEITAKLSLSNRSNTRKELWLGYTLRNPLGKHLDFPGKRITLNANDKKIIDMTIRKNFFPNDSFISGDYDTIFALWDKNPALEGAKRINHYEKENAIRIYSTMESFTTIDPKKWFSREGLLGRTLLTPKNVFIKEDLLNIRLLNNSYSGGEIRSLEEVHYGSYEISMQLPDAPSAITGFFLYKAPDYFHEIDIEIYNKKTTEILFTTYANGAVQNNTIFPLGFDPTATFNTYRIDYYPHEISFYVNGEETEKFTDGFSKEPMYLMVNTWYPNWLEGLQQKNDQHLKIQWIRY